ncbi:MAG: biotin/lipoate A/B protein ligase family protein [Candidatus Thorarchaeota archaeon]
MEEFRFLELSVHNAYENMAIDEAITLAMKEGEAPPTLRLYRWRPSAVSIGTFQGMIDEVDLKYCRLNKIDYIRRITGGGAVYHDFDGEVTYSLIVPKDHRLAPPDILKSYKIICGGIIEALKQLKIKSKFRAINDVVTSKKKISGNAQTRRNSCVLQHGTTLLDLDVEVMFSILKVPKEKISDKMIQDVKKSVTSIREVLGRHVEVDELGKALEAGFTKALKIDLVPGALMAREWADAQRLMKEKYSTTKWNLAR